MEEKAKAWKQYNDAAMAQMVIEKLPELARAISEPLSKVDKIIMVGENNGAPKITGQVASVLAQLPPIVENLTGIKLEDLLKRAKPSQDKEGK
jgi:flotillin